MKNLEREREMSETEMILWESNLAGSSLQRIHEQENENHEQQRTADLQGRLDSRLFSLLNSSSIYLNCSPF